MSTRGASGDGGADTHSVQIHKRLAARSRHKDKGLVKAGLTPVGIWKGARELQALGVTSGVVIE